ncbi:MAG: IS1595 family transposase [bacterium]
MEDYPKTLLEFEQRFGTEKACLKYLFRLRWPKGFRCPRCGYGKAWAMKGGLYRCVRCHLLTSVIAGTIFQDSKKPLRLWFRAIWHLTSQKYGANAIGLQRVLGLGSYRTSWTWLHKLRRAMIRPGRERLSGTVDVDETYIGGKKPGKRGRGAAGKSLVVVMVEVAEGKIGRIRLRRVPDASATSLENAVKEAIEPGSIIRTDGWESYGGLSKIGYIHEVIRDKADIGKNLLPRVNRVVALLKRWLLGTYQGRVEFSHLDYYLDEFTFRFNRRTSLSRGKLFYRLVQQAAAIAPIPAKDIRGGNGDS